MPLTNYVLDTFVAQDMSKLTACAPQSLAAEFLEHGHWLSSFVMRRILHSHVDEDKAALAFVLVRRAEAALDEWELACEAAKNVLKPSGYFKMLRHMENCIATLWQGLEFSRRALSTKLFERGDGNVYERLNWLYNFGRHFDPQELASGNLHRIWISNEGINSREQAVTFAELRETVRMLSNIASQISGTSSDPIIGDLMAANKICNSYFAHRRSGA